MEKSLPGAAAGSTGAGDAPLNSQRPSRGSAQSTRISGLCEGSMARPLPERWVGASPDLAAPTPGHHTPRGGSGTSVFLPAVSGGGSSDPRVTPINGATGPERAPVADFEI